MNYTTVDADFNVEERKAEVSRAAQTARNYGLDIWVHRPTDKSNPGCVEALFWTNSPTYPNGEPNKEQRYAALIVNKARNGEHTLAKMGIDVPATVAVENEDAKTYFFRVHDDAPKIPARQLGPGVHMIGAGKLPLPPDGGLVWAADTPTPVPFPEEFVTAEAIPEDEDPSSRGRFKRAASDALIQKIVPNPDDLGYGIVAAGKVVGLIGPVQAGKTFVAEQICAGLLKRGQKVFWIAHEDEAEDVVSNLLDMGTTEDAIRQHFYIYPTPDATDADARDFQGLVAAERPALVVWDNLATVLSAAGADENNNTKVSSWYRNYAKSVRKYSTASLVLDHIRDGHDQNARGARTKRAETDLMWSIKATREFTPDKTGEISFKCLKDKAWRKLKGTSRKFIAGGPDAAFIDNRLTENQRKALAALTDGMSSKDWRAAAVDAGVKYGSFGQFKAQLIDAGAVVEEDGGFYRV